MNERNYDQGVFRVGHVDESALLDFIQGRLKDQRAAHISEHLSRCLVCRVWANRLRHTTIEEPSDSIITGLVEASPKIPSSLQASLANNYSSDQRPSVGDLWRVGRAESLLVWVRRVFEDSASVIPVILDEDLADNFSLIVPLDQSPIDLELILLASVEGEVDFRAFLQRVGHLGLEDEIEAIRKARKKSEAPVGDFLVGPKITSEEDQRLEHRQVLSDLLASLSPGAFVEDLDVTDGLDVRSFLQELNEIKWRRRDTQVREVKLDHVLVDPAHELVLIAAVENLDLSILCTALMGPEPNKILSEETIAIASGQLIDRHEWADCVAVTIPHDDWSTVILPAASSHSAVEISTGILVGPRVQSQSLSLVDALAKYLESYESVSEETAITSLEMTDFDIVELGSSTASRAIEELIAEGKRVRTETAKKNAYVRFGTGEVSLIERFISAIVREQTSPKDALEKALKELKK